MSTRTLIEQLADAEEALRQSTFLAPCVRGSDVRTSLDGLVRTFTPTETFSGWGIFGPVDADRVEVEGSASRGERERYLELFEPLRATLVRELDDGTWLTVPSNRSDMEQRFGTSRPVVAHLVDRGRPFDGALLRFDGTSWWWERADRRADPRVADDLRSALAARVAPQRLDVRGAGPEQNQAYRIAWERLHSNRDETDADDPESRLRSALATGCGVLRDFADRGDTWRVDWETSTGERHSSVVTKDDLTVVGAGICLAGRDREFDLESLVGVVEKRPRY